VAAADYDNVVFFGHESLLIPVDASVPQVDRRAGHCILQLQAKTHKKEAVHTIGGRDHYQESIPAIIDLQEPAI